MEQPRLRAIADDVQARGKEFTLLARLSPVPSWANNYGLALAGVEFEDYLPASVVAVLPALVAHVLVGSSLAELSTSGGDSSPALLALSAASALVLVRSPRQRPLAEGRGRGGRAVRGGGGHVGSAARRPAWPKQTNKQVHAPRK